MSSGMVVRQERLFFEPRDIDEMGRLAKILVASRMFAIESHEQAAVIMMTGASLGLSVVAAMRGVHVIKGKPVLAADLMAAVVLGSGTCRYLTVIESTDQQCIMETHREGAPKPVRMPFTIKDAQRLGVSGNDNWRKSPDAMLRARATARLCRAVYPDLLFGVYVHGELDEHDEPREVSTVDVSDRLAQLAADPAPLIQQPEPAPEPAPVEREREPGEDDDRDVREGELPL